MCGGDPCQEKLSRLTKKILCLAFLQLWTHLVLCDAAVKKKKRGSMIKKSRNSLVFCGLTSLLVLFLCLAMSHPAFAETKSKNKGKKSKTRVKTSRVIATPPVSQRRYADIVIDAETGRILHETNGTALRHPASLTKMMTLYLTFQAIENSVLRLDTSLPVSSLAAGQAPSKLGLRAGQSVRAYDAIMGLVTESANDAAFVLAEALGGSADNFAKMMSDQARTLGMRGTVFRNPNGLPNDEQVTTARDMAILGHALIAHYPGFYSYFGRESFTYNGRVYRNHNHLMERYEGMDGIKTGYIRASGFNLVASAVRNNRRLIAAIFGGTSAPARDRAMEALLDQAFKDAERLEGTAVTEALPLPSKVASALALSRGRRTSPPSTQRAEVAPLDEAQESGGDEAPPVASRHATQSSGGWGIQVGAFGSIDAAQKYMVNISRIMAPLLGGAEQSLQKVTMTDGTEIYRTRFMGVEQKTARSACAYMIKHGQSCLVVSGP